MKVLVVDDDVVSRMVLMHLIDTCGEFEIHEAEDGLDAWKQMEGGLRPAICFCDLRMPNMSGMDLLERVKGDAALGAMPFVLVTSATDRATVDRANGLGADGYLVKPFEGEQVQGYLAPLAAPALDAETPRATMRRLGIDPLRLQAYLGGFQTQLTAASAELASLLAAGQLDDARVRLDRLHAGCMTLGLSGAAARFRSLPDTDPDSAQVQIVLAETVRDVLRQIAILQSSPSGA